MSPFFVDDTTYRGMEAERFTAEADGATEAQSFLDAADADIAKYNAKSAANDFTSWADGLIKGAGDFLGGIGNAVKQNAVTPEQAGEQPSGWQQLGDNAGEMVRPFGAGRILEGAGVIPKQSDEEIIAAGQQSEYDTYNRAVQNFKDIYGRDPDEQELAKQIRHEQSMEAIALGNAGEGLGTKPPKPIGANPKVAAATPEPTPTPEATPKQSNGAGGVKPSEVVQATPPNDASIGRTYEGVHINPGGETHAPGWGSNLQEVMGLDDPIVRELNDYGQKHIDENGPISFEQTTRDTLKKLGYADNIAEQILADPRGKPAAEANVLRTAMVAAESEARKAQAILDQAQKFGDRELESAASRLEMAGLRKLEVYMRASRKYNEELGRGLNSLKIGITQRMVKNAELSAAQRSYGWEQAGKELQKVAKTNGKVSQGTLEKMQKLVDATESAPNPEDIMPANGKNGVGGKSTNGKTTVPRQVDPEAAKAAEKAAPDPEMREFLDLLYQMRSLSGQADSLATSMPKYAEADVAAMSQIQKRMDGLMDGFLAKARKAKVDAEAEKAAKLQKRIDEEGVDVLGDTGAEKAVDPEKFDLKVMAAIQKRVEDIVAREGQMPTGEGAASEVRQLVGKAFGHMYNTAAEQKLAAKASIQIEKELNKTYGKAWKKHVGEVVGAVIDRYKRGSFPSDFEMARAELALDEMAKKRPDLGPAVSKFRADIASARSKAQEVAGQFAGGFNPEEAYRFEGMAGKDQKAIARMSMNIEKQINREYDLINADARAMESNAVRLTAKENVEKVREFLKSGGDSRLAAQALEATRSLGTEAKAAVKSYRMGWARQSAMRVVGTEAWDKLPQGKRDELMATLMRPEFFTDSRAFGRFSQAVSKPSLWDRIHTYRIWSMLSGPPTALLNAMGGGIETAYSPMVRFVEGTQAGGVSLGKKLVAEEFAGWVQAMDAAKAEFASTMQTGISARPIKDIGRVGSDAIPLGGDKTRMVLNGPLRILAAADDFWRTLNTGGALRAEAALKAHRTGGNADDILLNLVDHADVVKRAEDNALRRTYQQQSGTFQRGMNEMRLSSKALQTVVPFFNTIWNIARIGIERSPAGFIEAARLEKRGEFAAAAQRRAEATVGSMLLLPIGWQAIQGNITGYGPLDEKARKDWLDQGGQPYSIKVGDRWVSYTNLGPLMIPLAATASAVEGWKYGQGKPEDVMIKLVHSYGNLLLNISAMRGLTDVVNAITDPERYGERMASGIVSSFLVSGARGTAARVMDPEIKDPDNIMQAVMSGTPILSGQVKPQLTQLGEVRTRGGAGAEALLPFRTMQEKPNVVYGEYQRLREQGQDMGIGHVGDNLEGVTLESAEAASYDQLAGQLTNAFIEAAMADPAYQGLPPNMRAKKLEDARNRARNVARTVAKAQAGPTFTARQLQAKYGLTGR